MVREGKMPSRTSRRSQSPLAPVSVSSSPSTWPSSTVATAVSTASSGTGQPIAVDIVESSTDRRMPSISTPPPMLLQPSALQPPLPSKRTTASRSAGTAVVEPPTDVSTSCHSVPTSGVDPGSPVLVGAGSPPQATRGKTRAATATPALETKRGIRASFMHLF
jgi:hypothetical protein